MTRRRVLTDEEVLEARRRHRLWLQNNPKRIASELGISVKTLRRWIRGQYADRVA